MSETKIQWTTYTHNPWWGCARISPGCVNCYADTLAKRYGHEVWRRKGERRILSEANWKKPIKWNRDAEAAGKPELVFCASMADVFERHPDPAVNATLDGLRARLWETIDRTPWLTWQLLTKRVDNVADMVPWGDDWPRNVWLGTSVENQRYADERIPILMGIPARTRFLSCEPLIGAVDLTRWFGGICGCAAEPRERRLQGGREGGAEDRLGRVCLADCDPEVGSLDANIPSDHVSCPASGDDLWEVSPRTGYVRQPQGVRTGASAGLEAFPRAHPAWNDGESQEWGPDGQSSIQFGIGDLQGADSPREVGTSAGEARSVRTVESGREVDNRTSSGDLRPSSVWRSSACPSCGLRRPRADDIKDRKGTEAISWVIIGGESGPKSRPMRHEWATALRDQCAQFGVPAFFKQAGKVLGREWGCSDAKGGDPAEWPEPFPRELPEVWAPAGAVRV